MTLSLWSVVQIGFFTALFLALFKAVAVGAVVVLGRVRDPVEFLGVGLPALGLAGFFVWYYLSR